MAAGDQADQDATDGLALADDHARNLVLDRRCGAEELGWVERLERHARYGCGLAEKRTNLAEIVPMLVAVTVALSVPGPVLVPASLPMGAPTNAP